VFSTDGPKGNLKNLAGALILTAINTPFPNQVSNLKIGVLGDSVHADAQVLIAAQYKKHFDCDLKHFMSNTFSLYQGDVLKACTGFSAAGHSPLFLEQYLDQPIEAMLSEQFHCPVSRDDIVEIGGFAVDDKQFALPMMVQLAPAFRAAGFQYAVCTVTSVVQRCLDKIGIQSVSLGAADASRVDTTGNAWGKYYALTPVILAGNIQTNLEKITPFLELL